MPPPPAPPASPDETLDAAAISIRRLLSELSEQRIEAVLSRIVALRSAVEGLDSPHSAAVLAGFDRLLEDLGAVRYVANPLDHLDPLIHTVAEERERADAPNGVVVDTLRPGFRSPRGIVLAKARVAVNRRT
jgi:molecular chaperone GrpE (heat shock protein)